MITEINAQLLNTLQEPEASHKIIKDRFPNPRNALIYTFQRRPRKCPAMKPFMKVQSYDVTNGGKLLTFFSASLQQCQ